MERANFTGQQYGEATRQRQSQQVVPPAPPPTEGGGSQISLPPLDRPTEMPDQPITAGIGNPPPIGIQPGSREDLRLKVRAMAAKYPNSALLALLEYMESE